MWWELLRPVLAIWALAVVVSISASLLLSAVAQRLRKLGRPLLSRGIELIGAVPTLVLLSGAELTSLLPSWASFGLVLGLVQSLRLTRVLRIELVKLETHPELLAARALGVRGFTLLNDHLLPRFGSHFFFNAAMTPAEIVSLQAGMALLGLGARHPTTWGHSVVEAGPARWPAAAAIALFSALLIFGARRLEARLRQARGALRSAG